MMPKTSTATSRAAAGNGVVAAGNDIPAFVVTANGTLSGFRVDNDAFAVWVAAEGDELVRYVPALRDTSPGSTLSDLVYRALSAHVLVGDPGIELNIHGQADGAGYFVRLNNLSGGQLRVGLTRGRHELRWPPIDHLPSEKARHYLHEVCCIVNSLIADLLTRPDPATRETLLRSSRRTNVA
jgi:hypothetical protein